MIEEPEENINQKNKILLCPHCQKNLFDVDIIEVVSDFTTETLYWFSDYANVGNSNDTKKGKSYILCKSCRGAINITAYCMIRYYEGDTEKPILSKFEV